MLVAWERICTLCGISRATVHRERGRTSHTASKFTGWTAKRAGTADKENRLPYYFDLLAVELVVLDGMNELLQQGKTGAHLRQREALWLQHLFNRPSYQRPESTGITRVLGNKSRLSIPVVVLFPSTICQLLAHMQVAGTADSDQASLLLPEQVNDYGPRAEQGTLTLQDLNHLRAYLRLPPLPESNIQLQAYSTNHVGEPVFGIAV